MPMLLLAPALSGAEAARHELRLDDLHVVIDIAPADLEQRFGPRFDRSAVVRQVSLGGRRFVGRWGLCDEFGWKESALPGHAGARVGDEFMKIGVGVLRRDVATPYDFLRRYPVARMFPTEVSRPSTHQLEVRQEGRLDQDWAYALRKTYTLRPGGRLEIFYHITNTGARAWTLEHYNHHWWQPDGSVVDERLSLVFPHRLGPDADSRFVVGERTLSLPGPVQPDDYLAYRPVAGPEPGGDGGFILRVGNRPAIRCTTSFSPARVLAYAEHDSLCPELFHETTLLPKQSAKWSADYVFESDP